MSCDTGAFSKLPVASGKPRSPVRREAHVDCPVPFQAGLRGLRATHIIKVLRNTPDSRFLNVQTTEENPGLRAYPLAACRSFLNCRTSATRTRIPVGWLLVGFGRWT